MMMRRHMGFCLLWFCMSSQAAAQDPLDQLLKSLEGITLPFDVAVFSSLEETQDYRRQVEAVMVILDGREAIHNRTDVDDFKKTRVVCNALHLLDEYDVSLVETILSRLSGEENWKRRERDLLAYLCAKRGIQYDANVTYLLESLKFHETDLESPANGEVAWTVRDTCDTLSYLGDLFILNGDPRILDELFAYASIAFGYPAEYFSDGLTGMLLKRPDLFVASLARSPDKTIRDVTNSIVFGIRNDSVRKNIEEALSNKPEKAEGKEGEVVAHLRAAAEALRQQWAPEPDTANP
jgi:hypothetical protein